MANRKRPIVLRCPVTAEERALIEQKMAQLPTQRIGAYLRKMAIDGYIIYTDTADIKAFTKELSAIGRNINQIAKRINAGGPAYQADMDEMQSITASSTASVRIVYLFFIVGALHRIGISGGLHFHHSFRQGDHAAGVGTQEGGQFLVVHVDSLHHANNFQIFFLRKLRLQRTKAFLLLRDLLPNLFNVTTDLLSSCHSQINSFPNRSLHE